MHAVYGDDDTPLHDKPLGTRDGPSYLISDLIFFCLEDKIRLLGLSLLSYLLSRSYLSYQSRSTIISAFLIRFIYLI
jgi:hypothetical protein